MARCRRRNVAFGERPARCPPGRRRDQLRVRGLMADFPTVYWAGWDVDATFEPSEELPPASDGRLWAVLGFVFYGDKIVLADIEGRGWCIPSGRIEAGETIDEAIERECFEETGARLHP